MTRFETITPILLLLTIAGCAPPPICSALEGCNNGAAESGEPPPPDLPCGGADLLTDDANCGVCGHPCDVFFPESIYSSGHCIDGECSASLGQCGLVGENATCAEICQTDGGSTCMPRGCPGVQNQGVTALLWTTGEWGTCLPDPPKEELTLDCDAIVPFTTGLEQVSCCCL